MAGFDAQADARILHKAMKGLGTDEKALNAVIGNRTKAQLLQIAQAYQAEFKNTLEKDIKGDTSGDYETLLVGLISTVPQAKVKLLKYATKGAGTAEKYLIDVLATSTNAEILEMYQSDPTCVAAVLNDISNDDFSKVIKILLKGTRDENPNVNEAEAASVAEQLYKAGEGKLGTDEKVFTSIMTSRSVPFLKHMGKIYQANHKHDLETAIKKETSGDYERVLRALIKTKHEFFADRIWNATHGLGTDDHFVCYFFSVLSIEEIKHVAQIFHEHHADTTLQKQIIGDVSGHYGDLIKIILSHI